MKSIRLLLIISIGITISASCLAQDKQRKYIDSLYSRLNIAKEDTNKVNLYITILDELCYFKPEEGLKLINPALALAEKTNWNYGIVNLKYFIGRIHWRLGNFEEALKYHFETLQLSTEEGYEKWSVTTLVALGQDYADGGRYSQALIYLKKAQRKYEDLDDKNGQSYVVNILSWVYSSQGNYAESSKYNYESLRLYEELGDMGGVAVATSNLAEDYKNLGNYPEAEKYYKKSILLLQNVNDLINTANSYNGLGSINKQTGNYPEAIKNHLSALKIGSKINDAASISAANQGIGDVYMAQAKYADALKYYLISADKYKSISNKQQLASLYSDIGICYSWLKNYTEAKKYYDSSLTLSKELNSNVSFLDYFRGKEILDSITGNWESAYRNYKQYILVHDSTFNNQNINKMVATQMQYDAEKKAAVEKAEQEKKDIRQRNIRNSIAAGFTGSIIFLVVVYRQRNKISKARKRSDELLLNILPEEVAEELKEKGSAEAKHFNQVTVMFTDFKGFTQISEKLSPSELVAEIHYCFKSFDDIISKHNIEKIKTIGDAYMCAGGLPAPNETHATDVIKAALEILQFMKQHLEQRKNDGKEIFEIRIGVHTGPVVAGIVGVKKFAYDIWGDTVNTASRMESSGEAGKVNISGSTYEQVKDNPMAIGFNFIYRGKIQAKNKGEIDMYFVEQ